MDVFDVDVMSTECEDTERSLSTRGNEMTGLGAAVYGGFFALAALWLYMTADGDVVLDDDQGQQPERSNSSSDNDASVGSSPCFASQSSSK